MKHLLAIGYLIGGVVFFSVVPAQAQQVPPCPFSLAIDTMRLAGPCDTARVYTKDGYAYSKATDDKLNGFYSFHFYRKWDDSDAGMYNYPKQHTGYEQGGFLEGLKEGPWKCVRYHPIQQTWWECYRAGRLVNTTALPAVQNARQKHRKRHR